MEIIYLVLFKALSDTFHLSCIAIIWFFISNLKLDKRFSCKKNYVYEKKIIAYFLRYFYNITSIKLLQSKILKASLQILFW